jgi:Papain-like cysteine protease AvrRpt2
MTNPAPITFAQLWRYKAAPGTEAAARQDAAIVQLEEELKKGRPYSEVMRRSESWFSTWSQGKKLTDKPHPEAGILLKVSYFSQNDNTSGSGYRECFSSSCAMVAAFYGKIGGDDAYNRLRAKFGDTTDANAQIATLRHLGLSARLVTNCTAAFLDGALAAGRPVPVGWLHRGPSTAPTGGGHWSVVIGCDATSWIHNDPNGEADLIDGGYVNHSGGAGVHYSRKNWGRRWEVDGPATGWALDVRPQ